MALQPYGDASHVVKDLVKQFDHDRIQNRGLTNIQHIAKKAIETQSPHCGRGLNPAWAWQNFCVHLEKDLIGRRLEASEVQAVKKQAKLERPTLFISWMAFVSFYCFAESCRYCVSVCCVFSRVQVRRLSPSFQFVTCQMLFAVWKVHCFVVVRQSGHV